MIAYLNNNLAAGGVKPPLLGIFDPDILPLVVDVCMLLCLYRCRLSNMMFFLVLIASLSASFVLSFQVVILSPCGILASLQ